MSRDPDDFNVRGAIIAGELVPRYEVEGLREATIAEVVAYVRKLAGSGYPERRGKLHDIADDIEHEFASLSASGFVPEETNR